MSPVSASNESFPCLTKLLGNLRSGLKQFGYSEIQDLLRGRRDRDFKKKTSQKFQLLQDAIREIQRIDFKHSSDPGQIKFLLWKQISAAKGVNSKAAWDAENIGQNIVSHLLSPTDERLVCIPLFGSVAPWRKEPKTVRLSPGVWIFEPARSLDRLLIQLRDIFGKLPTEIVAEIKEIDDPESSEFAALLSEPAVACKTTGVVSQHNYALWRYGLPLIALRNLVTVNNLDTSDDLALLYYGMTLAPPAWPLEVTL